MESEKVQNETESDPDKGRQQGNTSEHQDQDGSAQQHKPSSSSTIPLDPKNTRPDHDTYQDEYTDNDDLDHVAVQRPKKPGFLSRLFTKLSLDAPTLLMMFKGSIPPTIGIVIYQSNVVASYFGSFGYLVPIITVMALVILPRGKFMMALVLNTILVCFGCAISMLALWSALQARYHTTPAGVNPLSPGYNPSQNVVCAIWLFANIWFANTLRAKLPSFNLPVIVYSILVNVATTYGAVMTSTAAAQVFIKQLLSAMLAALAIALGVNLLIIPVSSRQVLTRELSGCISLLRKTVSLQKAYLIRLESDDMFAIATRTETMIGEWNKASKNNKPRLTREAKAAKELQDSVARLKEMAGKLHADTPFAKRDVAWGKLDAKDLGKIISLFRNVYIPVLGMTTMTDIFKRISDRRGWVVDDTMSPEILAEKEVEKRVWNSVMLQMHEPFEILSEAIDQGLEHAAICLELLPRPRPAPKKDDVEAQAGGGDDNLRPGDLGFSHTVDTKVRAFNARRGELLRAWISEREVAMQEELVDNPEYTYSAGRIERDQVQFYILLFMENMMHTAGMAVQALVAFADAKVDDGTMARSRLILPGFRRLKKWVLGVVQGDSSAEQAPDFMEGNNGIVYFGDGYNRKKDPEHLPPVTAWQHFGQGLRKVSSFFGSEESAFGFRAACATMTIGIVAFLESTQRFFIEQRLVWAMIMVAIGMTMTSGQSFFGFICRVGGTITGMCTSLIIWYIVDEHPVGAMVFIWFFTFVDFYFFIKYPKLIPAIIITIVTQILIVAYELQVDKIGKAASERTGQPYYPAYELAPYRLATVAGGSLVAFIWTVFPSPMTDRTWLRRDLSATLYLLANYFSIVNSTLEARLHDTEGDPDDPDSPSHHLVKTRYKIFGKVMILLPSMSQHSYWEKFEPTIGGKYPREAYDEIILRSTRIMGYLTLMAYTLTHPVSLELENRKPKASLPETQPTPVLSEQSTAHDSDEIPPPPTYSDRDQENNRAWLNALAEVFDSLSPTNHTILSTLTLLSNSLLSGQSLPPFLPLPRPYEMTRRLMHLRHHHYHHHHRRRHSISSSISSSSPSTSSDPSQPIMLANALTAQPDTPTTRPDNISLNTVDLLDPRNMEQPGYAEFAALQVCTTLVCDDLEGLVKAVSGLVGVVDFSFRVGEGGRETGTGRGKGKGKVD